MTDCVYHKHTGLAYFGYNKHFRVNHGKNEFAFKVEQGATVRVNGIESFGVLLKEDWLNLMGQKQILNFALKNVIGEGIKTKLNFLKNYRKYSSLAKLFSNSEIIICYAIALLVVI